MNVQPIEVLFLVDNAVALHPDIGRVFIELSWRLGDLLVGRCERCWCELALAEQRNTRYAAQLRNRGSG